MRTFKLVLLTAILMSFCIGTLFAGGMALSGIGSKAISLGGAFRGMADDATAMYWNPAGIGFMDNNSFTIAGAGIIPNIEFENTLPLPGFSNEPVSAVKKLWMFPNLYAVKGGESKFKYGLGVYVPYGLGAKWDAFELPTTMMTESGPMDLVWSDGFPEYEMESSIGIVDAHPTFAYQFNDNFAMGLGVSVYYGMITIAKTVPNEFYSYYLPTTMNLEGTGMGYGGNLGFMWKVNEMAQMGLSGKLPAKINFEGDAELKVWLNNVVNFGFNGNDPAFFVPAVAAADPDVEATLNLPGDVGWGMSLKLNPNWTLNTDVSYTFWSTLDKITIELQEDVTMLGQPVENPVMETKWNDSFRLCLGTQYQMNNVALRGGFFYDETPVPDSSLTPILPDTAEKYSGNFGLGWQFGKWLLDLNYEHIFFAEREIEDQTEDNNVGIYNNSVDAFNMALTFTF